MKRGRLRAVDEAILQRDAKAAPQEALSFRPPDNSPFRRHFTRGFLLCLYAYSTRFAWECQCPFCTNPLGASLCRLRDARSGGGRDFRFGRDGERKACLRTDKGAGELNILCTPSIRPRFPARRRTARAFFACRREETAFLPRTGEPDRAFRALSDRLRFSHTPSDGRTEKRRAAGRSCGAAFFSPGQTSFAFLPNSLRISGRSRRGARKQ